MQVKRIGYGIRGFHWLARLGYVEGMIPKDAKERYHILQYWKKWKLEATREAFGVSRRTLYRWQARLREAGGDPAALAARSRRPRRVRRPTTPAPVVEQIRRLRQQYPNLGKAKVHCMLRPWCERRGLRCPSVSTIGRIIARAPDRMRLVPARLDSRGRPKPLRRVRKRRKPRRLQVEPLGLWAADTIERVRDGVRRYLLTLVDPVSRVAFAVALAGKSSRRTAAVLEAFLDCLGHPVAALLSDNGSEFQGRFHELVAERGITHYWTYPRSPKMNAHNERFNRSLQEQLVLDHRSAARAP